jgi:hypothetical protein
MAEGKSKFAQRLAGMKSTIEESKGTYDSMFAGVKIDPGTYIVRLQSAKIVETKSSGKLMIAREHIVTEGQWHGHVIRDYMNLESTMGMAFVRQWIDQCGYEFPDTNPEELEDVIEAIANESFVCKATIKQSGDFINLSVNEILSSSGDKTETKETPKEEPKKEESKKSEKTTSKKETKKEEPVVDEEQQKILKGLFAFCKNQDIETEKGDTLEVLQERIKEYEFPEEEMSEEEITLFESAELSSAIKRKPKATKVKK